MIEPDEKFFAWLDGELTGSAAAEMERRVNASAEHSKLAAEHRAMQARLKAAFDPIAEGAVPQPLQNAVHTSDAEVIGFAAKKRSGEARIWGSLPPWAAMAATLAAGILVGTLIQPRSAPVEVKGGQMYAAAALDHALTSELASAPNGTIRIGVTFRDRAGAVCRTFTQPAASGLACRQNGRWRLKGLFAAPEGQSGEYRMAGGMDPSVAALIDSTISGEPFNASQEKAARGHDWR